MLQRRLSYILILLLLLAEGSASAQYVDLVRLKKLKYQFMAFGVLSFYSNDNRITANTKASKGYGASFRVEIPLSKGIRFVPGMEIMHQGIDFDSYYFAPGYSTTFDNSFD
jgi:hypothetical protein